MASGFIGEISHRRVLRIAIPIVLANATVPMIGAVDTGVIGQLGLAAPIGAVGIGAIILSALYWFFGFLRMGTSGMTAQAVGAGNSQEVSAMLLRALLAGFGAGCLFIVFQAPIIWASFRLSPASIEVEVMAREYLRIRFLGAPAAIAAYGIFGWLIATERTRSVFVLQLWVNGLNAALDFLFVIGWGWGISGVAVASVISEWTALGLGLWLTRSHLSRERWKDWSAVLDRARLLRLAGINLDIMIRSVLLQASFVSFLFLGSSFDDATLAADQILIQFLHIAAFALDGFAFAAESLVGQAFGANNRSALRRAALLTSFWAFAFVIVLVALLYPLGEWLVALMATSQEVRTVTAEYLPWIAVLPLIGAGAWMLDGVFIGATKTRDLRNMMFVAFLAYCASVLYLLDAYGNHGLWAALLVFFLVRTLTLAVRYPTIERNLGGQQPAE